MRSLLPLAATLLLAPAAPAAPAPGTVLITAEEALELAFPEGEVERETVYLTEEQLEAASDLAGFEVETALVYAYTVRHEGEIVGHAWFDTHKVRTKRETIMIALTPDQRIHRIEVLAFAEPRDYLPNGKWYAQFLGRALSPDLRIQGEIRGVTGATMTARATARAVRENLAVHRVLHGPPPEPEPDEVASTSGGTGA